MVRTVGVEEEFLLVRTGLDGLAAWGEEVIGEAANRSTDPGAGGSGASASFEHELKREQAELNTPPCMAMTELGEQLHRLRRRLAVAPIRTDLLRAAQWRAARWGMAGDLVDPAAAVVVPAWEMAGRLIHWIRAGAGRDRRPRPGPGRPRPRAARGNRGGATTRHVEPVRADRGRAAGTRRRQVRTVTGT